MEDYVQHAKLEDTGTRYQHLADLLEQWELGIQVMKKYNYQSDEDQRKLAKLEGAADLVRRYMDTLTNYSVDVYDLRHEIDTIRLDKLLEGE